MDTGRPSPARAGGTVRRGGFGHACRTGGAPLAGHRPELATDVTAAVVVLLVAAFAWAVTIWQMTGPGPDMGSGMDMGPGRMGPAAGLGGIGSFTTTWTVMMAAMMLPSAIPVVHRFAHTAGGRRPRAVAVGTLGLVYLVVWTAFGVVGYLAYQALGMPWSHQALAGGAALGLVALHTLTPQQRTDRDHCREMCALHRPLPANPVRAGAVAGWRYARSCLGCTGGLMVAMVLIGMQSLAWTIVLALLVLAQKFSLRPTRRLDVALAAALVVLGIIYATLG